MKRFPLVLLVLVVAIPLSAGGKQESSGTMKESDKPMTMNVMVRNYTLNQDSPYKSAKAVFEKNHPNVTVNLEGLGYDDMRTKALLAVGAGQQLDAAQADYIWIGEYAEGKIFTPVTERLNADTALKNDIIPTFLNASTWKGQVYGLWLNTDVRILGWVKKHLADAGIDPEKAPATYTELVQNAVKAQHQPDTYGYFFPLFSGENTVERWYGPLGAAGGQILSSDFTKALFNSDAGVKALQFYVDAVNKYKIIPKDAYDDAVDSDALNWEQRLVYCYDFFAWEKAQEVGWDAAKYNSVYGTSINPMFEGGKHATTSGGYVIGIPRTAANPDLSWEFIKLVTSPANVKDFLAQQARIGTRKSLSQYSAELTKNNPVYSVQADSLNYTNIPPWNPEYPKMLEPMYTAIQKATLLQATPKEALDEAAAAVDKILAK
jgi:multiple sugar transport system substrate-binding protein